MYDASNDNVSQTSYKYWTPEIEALCKDSKPIKRTVTDTCKQCKQCSSSLTKIKNIFDYMHYGLQTNKMDGFEVDMEFQQPSDDQICLQSHLSPAITTFFGDFKKYAETNFQKTYTLVLTVASGVHPYNFGAINYLQTNKGIFDYVQPMLYWVPQYTWGSCGGVTPNTCPNKNCKSEIYWNTLLNLWTSIELGDTKLLPVFTTQRNFDQTQGNYLFTCNDALNLKKYFFEQSSSQRVTEISGCSFWQGVDGKAVNTDNFIKYLRGDDSTICETLPPTPKPTPAPPTPKPPPPPCHKEGYKGCTPEIHCCKGLKCNSTSYDGKGVCHTTTLTASEQQCYDVVSTNTQLIVRQENIVKHRLVNNLVINHVIFQMFQDEQPFVCEI